MEEGSRRLLIDTPPELRLQLLRAGVKRIDAVWYTHAHADHLHGIDDLRAFQKRGPVSAYASETHRRRIARSFPYIFGSDARAGRRSTIPRIDLKSFDGESPVRLLGLDLGYVTDAKSLPAPALAALRGVRVLVLNALWFGDPHPAHFSVEEAVAAARRVGAERTYLTHLTHRVSHGELEERLPEGIFGAFDGLTVEVEARDAG